MFADGGKNLRRQHSAAPDAAEELSEHPRQFRLVVVIGADIEDERVIRSVMQKTLVALVRLENQHVAPSGAVVPGVVRGAEAFVQRSGDHLRVPSQLRQRFGQIAGDGAFAAAAGDGDGGAPGTLQQHTQQFGAVEPWQISRREKIGIVRFDGGAVNQSFGQRRRGEPGAVQRPDRDPPAFQGAEDRRVFRSVRAPVAPADAPVPRGGGRRQRTHSDPADTDKMQIFHVLSDFWI